MHHCSEILVSGLETREMMEPFMRSKAQAWMMVLRELTILGWFVTASHALSTMLIVKTRSHDC